ncbi:MAG: deoxyribonuclease IV [Longimicrobiales bacterium]
MSERILGSHTVDNGGIDMALRRAVNAGLDTVQIFTAIPKFYGDRTTIRAERVERFKRALEETGVRPQHVLVHAAYVLGVTTSDPIKWTRSARGLLKELERSTLLGVGAVCFHPGSVDDADPAAAAERAARAMAEALEAVPGGTQLLVENTAGGGRTLGRTAAEVGQILSHVPDRHRSRAGYGLDTCHLFASGYDITASREALSAVLDAFQQAAGEPPSFFHLNDSAGGLGSNRDRHVLIGEGQIGTEPFAWLLEDSRTAGVPLILETPQQNYTVAADDPSGDPYDVRMNELLRSLL